MTITRPALAFAMIGGLLVGTWLASHGSTHAQVGTDRPKPAQAGHISDILLQKMDLRFASGIGLQALAADLRQRTGANVVLDLAALERHELEPTRQVRIDLGDVRLKTGLKLLLDQVGLTIKVVPEDNLLIVTDHAEVDEPIERVLSEIKALHRDLHDVQDEVRDLRDILETPMEGDEDPVVRLRNPTIIEEQQGKPTDTSPAEARTKSRDRDNGGSTRSRPGV